jgi:hypothetical protein
MDEFQNGLISSNEYRIASGRKDVESDLADSLLMNPNLTPIANTKKKMEEAPQAQMGGAPPGAMPGMPPGIPAGAPPEGAPAPDPTTMEGAMQLAGAAPAAPGVETTAEPMAPGQMSAIANAPLQTKADIEWENSSNMALSRWTQILDRSLERIFERQQRVVLEKASGAKARKQLATGSLDIETIFNRDTWARQMEEDIKPVLTSILNDARDMYTEKKLPTKPFTKEDAIAHVNSQIERIKQINDDTFGELSASMFTSLNAPSEDDRNTLFRSSVVSIFTNVLGKKRPEIAEAEARRAWNAGIQG